MEASAISRNPWYRFVPAYGRYHKAQLVGKRDHQGSHQMVSWLAAVMGTEIPYNRVPNAVALLAPPSSLTMRGG